MALRASWHCRVPARLLAVLHWPVGTHDRGAVTGMAGWSDGQRELAEGLADPVAARDAGGEFAVAAAEVLGEGVPGSHDDPRGPVSQAAHRPQPGLQPAMIGPDLAARLPPVGMHGGGDQEREAQAHDR
jgi:hypothetical protein